MLIEFKQKQCAIRCALSQPNMGGSVWPEQCCPAFAQRLVALGADHECWYCKFADFHLQERVALDVGICCWPRVCME